MSGKAFLMVQYQMPEAILELQRQIDPEDLFVSQKRGFTYGLETEPHVTIAPCLRNNVKPDNLKKFLQPLQKYRLELVNLEVFENEDFDVLHFVVKCDALHLAYNKFTKQYTLGDKYPDYNPHITVAYLKKGKGSAYTKLKFPSQLMMEPTSFAFSHLVDRNREKVVFTDTKD